MDTVRLAGVTRFVRESWSAETSASPEAWSVENPALGQCAVTACLIQDYMGGDILNSKVTLPDGTVVSHYFNLIEDQAIDATKEQFPRDAQFGEAGPKTGEYQTTRDYVLSFDATKERYDNLRRSVSKRLALHALSY